MSIQPLPSDVIAQIKSSISITNLNGVVCELVKNALDAGCTKIDISVDYGRGGCSVEDDGFGILPSEFRTDGHLGKLYHSSKFNSQSPVHGGRGTFLAALSAMALISITSHHHLHRSHNMLTMYKSEVVSRHVPAPPLHYVANPSHGTRVTVRDLFGNMPVRVKQRAIEAEKHGGNMKDWEELRRDVVSLLLSWPNNVALTMRGPESNQKINIRPLSAPLESEKRSANSVCSILSQASFISRDEKSSWVSVGVSTPKISISGVISLDPIATKNLQFLSLGIQPLRASDGQSILHDEINRLFSNSTFGVVEGVNELDMVELERRARDGRYKVDSYTSKELKGTKKGVDRWPMFCINIQNNEVESLRSQLDELLDDKGQTLSMIMELLQAMMTEFLMKHHFRPKVGRSRRVNETTEETLGQSTTDSPTKLMHSFQEGRQSPKATRLAKHFTTGMKKSSLKTKYQPDPLGTSIRMPSFRQGVRSPDSPFDSWSRIKKGASVSRPITPKNALVPSEGCQIVRPSTAPPLSGAVPFSSAPRSTTPELSKRKPTRLLSKDGKIVRPPFDDTISINPAPKTGQLLTGRTPPPINAEKHVEINDDIVVWTNPITKVESLINQRTGLTMKPTTSSSRDRFSRVSSSRLNSAASTTQVPSPWISEILRSWDNPIFQPTQPSIPQVAFDGPDATTQNILHGLHHHCSQIEIDRAFKESASGITGRMSKDALKHAAIIAQVDRKFILVKMQSSNPPAPASSPHEGDTMLVLIDQHAADERIRVETLMEELCTPPPTDLATTPGSKILTTLLDKPLKFEIHSKEVQILHTHQSHFANWGILYSFSPPIDISTMQQFTVHSLPPGINERCRLDPRLLIDLIRTEVWKVHEKRKSPAVLLESGDWLQRIHTCPQGIIDMLNSRACRSAVMFNDELSKEQCETLVRRLAGCKFPFQCAHGRPSLVPLVDVAVLKLGTSMGVFGSGKEDRFGGFGVRFNSWKEGRG